MKKREKRNKAVRLTKTSIQTRNSRLANTVDKGWQKEQMKILAATKEVYALVYSFFKNVKKTDIWFTLPNPHLGGATPLNMILSGRKNKLLKWVKNTLSENKR